MLRHFAGCIWGCAVACVLVSAAQCSGGAISSQADFQALIDQTSATLMARRSGLLEASFTMQDPEVHSVSSHAELQQLRTCRICWNGPDYWIVARYSYLTSPSREAAKMSYDRGVPATGAVILGRPQMLFAFREGARRGSVRLVEKLVLNEQNEVLRTQASAVYSPDAQKQVPTEVIEFQYLIMNGLLADWNSREDRTTVSRAGSDVFSIESESTVLYGGALRGRVSANISDIGSINSLAFDSEGGHSGFDVAATDAFQFEGITFNRRVASVRSYLRSETPRFVNIQMSLRKIEKVGPKSAVKKCVDAVFNTEKVLNASQEDVPFKEIDATEISRIGMAFPVLD